MRTNGRSAPAAPIPHRPKRRCILTHLVNEFHDTGWVQRTEIEAERYGAECHFVWVASDEDTLHQRLRHRGARRDEWKLNHWDLWYHSVPKSPPKITGLVVLNNQAHANPTVQQQIVDFLAKLNIEVGS